MSTPTVDALHTSMFGHDDDCGDYDACSNSGLFGCDVCGRDVLRCTITKSTAFGIETYACGKCTKREVSR